MRGVYLGSVLALAALPAMAQSSIQELDEPGDLYGSIVSIDCKTCVDPEDTAKPDYIVPELKPGTQTVEIIDTEDGKELVRTDAWAGGSPVRRISMTQAVLVERAQQIMAEAEQRKRDELEAQKAAEMDDPGIDRDATTAAVTPESEAIAAGMDDAHAEDAVFDPSKLEMRLD